MAFIRHAVCVSLLLTVQLLAIDSQTTCESATSTLFSDADCSASFNATLASADPPTVEDINRVCTQNSTCNLAIENYFASCGNAIQGSLFRAICARNGESTCGEVVANGFGTFNDLIVLGLPFLLGRCHSIIETGVCSADCNDTLSPYGFLGCCTGEGIRYALSFNSSFDPLFGYLSRDFFTACGLPEPGFCVDGPTPPPNLCFTATIALFEPNDTCTQAYQQLLADPSAAVSDPVATIAGLLGIPGCGDRIAAYFTTCLVPENGQINPLEGLQPFFGLTTVIDPSNNISCSNFLSNFTSFSTDVFLTACAGVSPTSCPSNCSQLLNILPNIGCCGSEILRAIGTNNTVLQPLGNLCEVAIPPYCNDTENPTLIPCSIAQNDLFLPNDECSAAATVILDVVDTFGSADANMVSRTMQTICLMDGCTQRVSGFINHCLGNVNDSNYLITNYGCQFNRANQSCYALLASGDLREVQDAFNPDDFAGSACIFASVQCNSACRTILSTAVAEYDCCLYEFGLLAVRQLSGAQAFSIDDIYTMCDLPNNGNCSNTQPNTGGGGSAAAISASVLLTTLLLLVAIN